MFKIIVDCMGGDHSPDANILGSINAIKNHSDLFLVLTGPKALIESKLKEYGYSGDRLEIIDAPDVISCDDKPTDAIRLKKESSLMKGIKLLRESDEYSGLVSIGSSGAIVAAGTLRVGRIKGVLRPPFCPILPTMNGGLVAVCDSGANAECSPAMLQQFAIMASLYMENVYSVKNPRIALLNVGVEEHKGDELRQETYKLLKATEGINFVGNMESRDLMSGSYDVVVCDGFSGNVLIKTTEGTALELLKKLKTGIMSKGIYKLGALFMKGLFANFKKTMDYQNYGGSVLLGTSKVIIKGHGSSKTLAFEKSIEQAYLMCKTSINEKIEQLIEKNTPEEFK